MPQLLLLLSALLYLAACCTPALTFRIYSDDPARFTLETQRGIKLLGTGWMALLFGHVAWLANPAWIAGGVYLLRGDLVKARLWSAISVALALVTLQLYRKWLPRDEGGVMKALLHAPRVGFCLWLASMVTALIAALVWPVA